jgi:hypothetical protein
MPLIGCHQGPNILKYAEHPSMINYRSCIRGPLKYSHCILGFCSVLYAAELCMLRGINFGPLEQTEIYNMGSNGKLTLV